MIVGADAECVVEVAERNVADGVWAIRAATDELLRACTRIGARDGHSTADVDWTVVIPRRDPVSLIWNQSVENMISKSRRE